MSAPEPKPHPRPEVIERLGDGVERLLRGGATYEEIKVDDLVKEGGIAKSTFYVYFDDKVGLLRVLAERVMSDLIGFEGAWWMLPPDADEDAIQAAVGAMFAAYRAHGLLLDAVTAAAIYDRGMKAQFAELMTGVVEATADYLRRGQMAGLVPAPLDPDRTGFALTWMLERGFNRLLLGADEASLERRLAAVAEVIWSTCRGGPA
jgi:TetR/AcrR family transcriptional regulator, ethionamide resistance regulator